MDNIDEAISYLTEMLIKQYEKDKVKGMEYITISKQCLFKKLIDMMKLIKKS